MPNLPTFDYEAESADLKRRQAIIDALQGGSLQPLDTQQIGGVAIQRSPLEALAKVAQAYMARHGQDRLKEERGALAQRYSDDLRKGMEAFERTSTGYEAPSMALQPNADGIPQMQQVPGNARKAIFDALASNHPMLQQFAMQQMKDAQKDRLTPKDLLGVATPESVLANPGNTAGWKPKRDIGEVGGTIYDKNSLQTVQLGGPKPTQVSFGGDLYEVSPSTGSYRQLDNAPKVNVNANPVIAGQKAGLSEYFKNAASTVDKLGAVAQNATGIKQTLAEMKNLDANGIFSNVTTGPTTFLTNLGQIAGVRVDPNKLGNTEAFNALSTDLWQGLVSKFGGNRGVTQQEAAEIKKMLPLAASSPQARQQLYSILGNIADRQIAQYQNANRSFARAAKMDDPELFSAEFGDVYVPQPNTPQPTTKPNGKGPSVSNW